MTHCLWPL